MRRASPVYPCSSSMWVTNTKTPHTTGAREEKTQKARSAADWREQAKKDCKRARTKPRACYKQRPGDATRSNTVVTHGETAIQDRDRSPGSAVYPSFDGTVNEFYDVILWSTRVYTIENCCRSIFYNNKDKLRTELALLSDEKARALHLTSFLLSVLLSRG